jgi:hypothetical protein
MNQMPSEQELREQIIEKAWTDANFKKKLLADPKAAIQEAFGVEIPDGYKLQVLEETDDSFYLVLPQSPAGISKAYSTADESEGARWT